MSKDRVELKSCPFCGDEDVQLWGRPDVLESVIQCSGCTIEFKMFENHFDTIIEAWNTRQSRQINIDELTGVIDLSLRSAAVYQNIGAGMYINAANLIAQAISSHLNGKGDN